MPKPIEPAPAPPRPSRPRSGGVAGETPFAAAIRQARELAQLHALLVSHRGQAVVEQAFQGPPLDRPVNIKSLAKTVLSLMVGVAIDKGLLEGPEQKICSLLADHLPSDPDPRLAEITLGNLLSMQAGLERTSGRNYGRWVTSDNWVAYALSRPFVDEPGGRMLYSSGNSHLISAILTRVSGRNTLDLAREWLAKPLDIKIPPWQQDPQGVYFGGNNMLLSPKAVLRIGEACRAGGSFQGRRVVSQAWIERSWKPRTFSPFTGHRYGYGWFITLAGSYPAYYGWGFGGQLLYVIPDIELTVVLISDSSQASRGNYVRSLHQLVTEILVPAAKLN